jgi:tRNA threonylcarbamoyladenosine biosynthesis protein TsaB
MLLAVDTSTIQMGLAVFDGEKILAETAWESRAHHTRQLASAVDELFKRLEITMNDIAAIGVATGPGSFTSLRVGLAFVKGVALARHIPVIGIPSLDILAAAIPPSRKHKLGAVLVAGRGRLALVWYHADSRGWKGEVQPVVVTVEDLVRQIRKPVILCGELSPEDRRRLGRKYKNVTLASPEDCIRRPAILAELAWQKWQTGKIESASSLAPIYLHTVGGPPA